MAEGFTSNMNALSNLSVEEYRTRKVALITGKFKKI